MLRLDQIEVPALAREQSRPLATVLSDGEMLCRRIGIYRKFQGSKRRPYRRIQQAWVRIVNVGQPSECAHPRDRTQQRRDGGDMVTLL